MKNQRSGIRKGLSPMVLALMTKEGAMSQGIQVTYRNWTVQGKGSALEPPESTAAPQTP